MKKKFMYILLIIFMICKSSIHTTMKQKTQTDDELPDKKDRREKKTILLNDFLKFNQEKRKQLLNKLSIVKHAILQVNLDMHDFIKKFSCNDFDYSKQLLKNKIYDSLNQATNQDVLYWYNEIEWFKEINRCPSKAQNIIENVLRSIIMPTPKVLFNWNFARNVRWIDSNPDGTRNVVLYEDGSGKIIDSKYGEVLCERNDIRWMRLNSAGTKAIVRYENDRGEIINLNYNQNIVFTELKPEELLLIFFLRNLNFFAITDNFVQYYPLWQSFTSSLKQKLQNSYFSKKINTLIQAMGKAQQKI